MDHAGKIRTGEALDLGGASGRPMTLPTCSARRRSALVDQLPAATSSPVTKSRCATNGQEVGVVDLDRDQAQPLALAVAPSRGAAARTGRSASCSRPGRRARPCRAPRSPGRRPPAGSRAAFRRRRAGRARARRPRGRRGSCPACAITTASSGSASSASAVAKVVTPKRSLDVLAHLRRGLGDAAATRKRLGQAEQVRQVLDLRDQSAADDADVDRSHCLFSPALRVDAEAGLQRHAGEVGESRVVA